MAERIGLARTNINVCLRGIRMLFATLCLQTTTHCRTFVACATWTVLRPNVRI